MEYGLIAASGHASDAQQSAVMNFPLPISIVI
jgi:hypothetical protein